MNKLNRLANVKSCRFCAFCTHWYDPTNQHIAPKSPLGGFWMFNGNAKAMCTVHGTNRLSYSTCSKFHNKIASAKK
jgi:hypothetical protein